jgi:beta-N-acetylhexosaminidase
MSGVHQAADVAAVLLPVLPNLVLDDWIGEHFKAGGVAALLGETRHEYVTRHMSADRRTHETRGDIEGLTSTIRRLACGPVLIAADQELAGIQRLSHFVPPLPTLGEAHAHSSDDLAAACAQTAQTMREVGVNMSLAPIVDVVVGPSLWLRARTLGPDPSEIVRIATAYVKGFSQGGVATTAKHFPGSRGVSQDPATELAVVPGSLSEVLADVELFRALVNAGVPAVMTGPARIAALDDQRSASTSPVVIKLLRERIGFQGVVVSDDLDSASIAQGQGLGTVAVQALNAGADLLLIPGGQSVRDVVAAIQSAVDVGELDRARVADAADRVRSLANRVS